MSTTSLLPTWRRRSNSTRTGPRATCAPHALLSGSVGGRGVDVESHLRRLWSSRCATDVARGVQGGDAARESARGAPNGRFGASALPTFNGIGDTDIIDIPAARARRRACATHTSRSSGRTTVMLQGRGAAHASGQRPQLFCACAAAALRAPPCTSRSPRRRPSPVQVCAMRPRLREPSGHARGHTGGRRAHDGRPARTGGEVQGRCVGTLVG